MKIDIIKCKQCSAPLSLLGNNYRNKNLICQYCGTVMDTKNEFRALYTFRHIQAEDNKFKIGNQYDFDSRTFIVTGFIAYQSHETQWLEYQLYSYTHGYSKLVKLDNRYIFLKKTHHLPIPNIWMLKKGKSFMSQNKSFKIESFYFSEIYYAAGNLTEKMIQGKRKKHCFANNNSHWFYSIHRRNAIENYIGYEIQQHQFMALNNYSVTNSSY